MGKRRRPILLLAQASSHSLPARGKRVRELTLVAWYVEGRKGAMGKSRMQTSLQLNSQYKSCPIRYISAPKLYVYEPYAYIKISNRNKSTVEKSEFTMQKTLFHFEFGALPLPLPLAGCPSMKKCIPLRSNTYNSKKTFFPLSGVFSTETLVMKVVFN